MADLLFKLVRPALFYLDPERAHRVSIWALKLGLAGRVRRPDDPILATNVWNIAFPNPIGLAAGYDKDAEVCDGALALGGTGTGPQSLAFDFQGLDWAQLFEALKEEYGIWGLARLEAFVRLADHRASETGAPPAAALDRKEAAE